MPAALEQLIRTHAPVPVADAVRLRVFLCCVPDPRDRRGRRYPLVALLPAAAAGVLAGARSLVAIGEWIADAPRWALHALGFPPDPLTGSVPTPHPATVRRFLARLDGDAVDHAVGAFLHSRTDAPHPGPAQRPALRAIAVDGRTLRGSRHGDRPAAALLAAMEHSGSVLAPRQVADKSNEIPAFAPLLNPLELTGTVVTADALHPRHEHGAYLRSRSAHHLAIGKKNHPGLFETVRTLPWRDIARDHYDRTRAHHRMEIRRLKTAAFARLDYPGARQALQVVRWRREMDTGKLTIERVCLITSLPPGEATGEQLAAWIRATGTSKTCCTTCATGPSARTTPRSAPSTCPA
ncbi:ISAs1 family transposase [Streptomyces sp. NPDC059862]|uniref:ISAs1 family transposase n=1 Tax=Streptomyces sp. NPDC059862 TaxID=3346975 RepID=UPI0036671F63